MGRHSFKPGNSRTERSIESLVIRQTAQVATAVAKKRIHVRKSAAASLSQAAPETLEKRQMMTSDVLAANLSVHPLYADSSQSLSADSKAIADILATMPAEEMRLQQAIDTLTAEGTTLSASLAASISKLSALQAELQHAAVALDQQAWGRAGAIPGSTGYLPLSTYLYSATLSPDGSKILGTSRYEHVTLIINAKTGVIEQSLADHSHVSTNGAWSKDGNFFVTGGHDRTVHIWDAKTFTVRASITTNGAVDSTSISPDSKYIAVSDASGVRIIDATTNLIIRTLGPGTRQASFSTDSASVFYLENDQIKKYTIANAATNPLAALASSPLNFPACDPSGTYLAQGGANGILTLLRTDGTTNGRVALSGLCTQPNQFVSAAAFSFDGSMLVTGTTDGNIAVFDMTAKDANGTPLKIGTFTTGQRVSTISVTNRTILANLEGAGIATFALPASTAGRDAAAIQAELSATQTARDALDADIQALSIQKISLVSGLQETYRTKNVLMHSVGPDVVSHLSQSILDATTATDALIATPLPSGPYAGSNPTETTGSVLARAASLATSASRVCELQDWTQALKTHCSLQADNDACNVLLVRLASRGDSIKAAIANSMSDIQALGLNTPALIAQIQSLTDAIAARTARITALQAELTNQPLAVDTNTWGTANAPSGATGYKPLSTYLYTGVLSPDGSKILGTSRYENVSLIINAKTGVIEKSLADHTNVSTNGTWSKDGTFFVTGGHDQTLTIWDAKTFTVRASIPTNGAVDSSVISPDGTSVCITDRSGVSIIDVATKRIVKTIGPETYFGSFSIDSTSVYYSENGQLKNYTLATGAIRTVAAQASTPAGAPAIDPKGIYVAAGGMNTITLVRTDNQPNGRVVLTGLCMQANQFVCSVAFSPDGSMLVAGSTDGMVTVFDMTKMSTDGVPLKVSSFSTGQRVSTVSVTSRTIVANFEGAGIATFSLPGVTGTRDAALIQADITAEQTQKTLAESQKALAQASLDNVTGYSALITSLSRHLATLDWSTHADTLSTQSFTALQTLSSHFLARPLPSDYTPAMATLPNAASLVLAQSKSITYQKNLAQSLSDALKIVRSHTTDGAALGQIDGIVTSVSNRMTQLDGLSDQLTSDAMALFNKHVQDYATFLNSPDMQSTTNETDPHGVIAMDRLSARLEKITGLSSELQAVVEFVQRKMQAGQMVQTSAALANAQTLSDTLSQLNDTWQHDNRVLQYRLTGTVTDEGRINDLRTAVMPAIVGPASQGELSSLSTGVPELGGVLSITSVRRGTAAFASLNSAGQTVTAAGRLTTIDLASVASIVTRISFTLTATQPTTITFVHGETVLSSQTFNPGDTVSYSDESGITGVIIEHALTPLSQLGQDAYQDITFGAGRIERIWDLRTYGGRYTDTLDKQLDGYLGRKNLQITPAQRQAVMTELVQGGPQAAAVTISNITLDGLKDYRLNDTPGSTTIAGNGVVAARAGAIMAAANPRDMSIASNSSIYFPRGGETANNPMGWYMPVPNQNAYTRFDVHGTAEIGGIFYVGTSCWQELPQEYYDVIGQSVILKPGAPAGVIVSIRSCSGTYSITTKTGTQQKESVMPPTDLTLATDYKGVFTQPTDTPGFSEGILDTSTKKPQRVLIGGGLMVVVFENMGQTGGTIRSEIYTGFASNVRAQKLGEYSTTIAPNVPLTLKANVSSPNIPSNGDEPAIITIVTTLPNGQQKVDTIAVNRRANSSMSRTIKDGKVTETPRLLTDAEQARIVHLMPKIVDAAIHQGLVDATVSGYTKQYAALYKLFDDAVMGDVATAVLSTAKKTPDGTLVDVPTGVGLLAMSEVAQQMSSSVSNLAGQLEAMPYMQLIFSKLSLPMDNTNGLLYVQDGSPDHVGLEQNAVDFNLRGSANVEIGKPIKAMADGMVVEYNEQEGRIVMRHEVVDPSSGQTIVFFTEFGHMQNIDPSIVGKTLKAGDIIGQAGKIDTPTSNIHTNLIWSPLSESSDFASLDLRPWLKQKGIAIEAPKPGSVRNIGGPSLSPLDVVSMQQSGALNVLNGSWNLVRINGVTRLSSPIPLANEPGIVLLSNTTTLPMDTLIGTKRVDLANQFNETMKNIAFGDILNIHGVFQAVDLAMNQQILELGSRLNVTKGLEYAGLVEAIGVLRGLTWDLKMLEFITPTNALEAITYIVGGKFFQLGGELIFVSLERKFGASAGMIAISKLMNEVSKVPDFDIGAYMKNLAQSIAQRGSKSIEEVLVTTEGKLPFTPNSVNIANRVGQKIEEIVSEEKIQRSVQHAIKGGIENGKLVGGHSLDEAQKGTYYELVPNTLKINPKTGVGIADIRMQNPQTKLWEIKKNTTLYPKGWDEDIIADAMRYIAKNPIKTTDKFSEKYIQGTYKNVNIKIMKYNNSVFPIY